MDFQIVESKAGDSLWAHVAEHSPRTIRWIEDSKDDGDYHCFVATGDQDEFLGLCVIDIGSMYFGPLADRMVGFLEEALVLEPYRRKGIGTALVRAALSFAWQCGADHVRWTVDYQSTESIAFSQSIGVAFVPEEDPDAEQPEKYYTVVAINPKLIKGC